MCSVGDGRESNNYCNFFQFKSIKLSNSPKSQLPLSPSLLSTYLLSFHLISPFYNMHNISSFLHPPIFPLIPPPPPLLHLEGFPFLCPSYERNEKKDILPFPFSLPPLFHRFL